MQSRAGSGRRAEGRKPFLSWRWRRSSSGCWALMPAEAHRVHADGSTEDVPVTALQHGDRVLICGRSW